MGGNGSGEGEWRATCGLRLDLEGVAKGFGRDGLDARCEDEGRSVSLFLFLTGENGLEDETGGSTLIARDFGITDEDACRRR